MPHPVFFRAHPSVRQHEFGGRQKMFHTESCSPSYKVLQYMLMMKEEVLMLSTVYKIIEGSFLNESDYSRFCHLGMEEKKQRGKQCF